MEAEYPEKPEIPQGTRSVSRRKSYPLLRNSKSDPLFTCPSDPILSLSFVVALALHYPRAPPSKAKARLIDEAFVRKGRRSTSAHPSPPLPRLASSSRLDPERPIFLSPHPPATFILAHS